MSTIDKLSITGIRSFDPQSRQEIVFQKPLTIILGRNGAGKTTIIEALLNACTGVMPPGASGTEKSSFVFDPKSASDNSMGVKAQIKLRFNARGEKEVAVIRSYNAGWNKDRTKTQFSTLDSTIAYQDEGTGKVIQQSLRASDCDVRVPELLGVSRAVLEHVIFCHQEDSNWPLMSPAIVKQNFDDMFSATRYAAALDKLKEIKKKYTDDIKVKEKELLLLREDKEQAKIMSESIEQKMSFVNKTNESVSATDPKLQKLEQGMRRLDHVSRSSEEILTEVAVLHGRIDEKKRVLRVQQRQQEDLSMNTLPENPAEVLETLILDRDKLDKSLREMKVKLQEATSSLENHQNILREHENDMARARAEKEHLSDEERAFSQSRIELSNFFHELVREGGVSSLEGSLEELKSMEPRKIDSGLIARVENDLSMGLQRAQETLEVRERRATDAKADLTRKLHETQREMDAVTNEREMLMKKLQALGSSENEKDYILKELEKKGQLLLLNSHVFDSLSNDARVDFTHGNAGEVATLLDSVISDFFQRVKASQKAKWSGKLHQEEEKTLSSINNLNSKLAALRVSLSGRNAENRDTAQLSFINDQLSTKKGAFSVFITSNVIPLFQEQLQQWIQMGKGFEEGSVIDETCNLTQLSMTTERFREVASQELQALLNAKNSIDRELTGTRFSLQGRTEEVKNNQNLLTVLQQRFERAKTALNVENLIPQGLTITNFEECLKHLEEKYIHTSKKITSLETLHKCYSDFMEQAKCDEKCILCERPLDQIELANFIAINENRQNTTPHEIEEASCEAKCLLGILEQLKIYAPLVRQIQNVEESTLTLQRDVDALTEKVHIQIDTYTQAASQLSQFETIHEGVLQLFDNVRKANLMSQEVESLERDAHRIQARIVASQSLSSQQKDSAVSTEQLQRDHDQCMKEMTDLNNKLQDIRTQRMAEESAVGFDPLEIALNEKKNCQVELRLITSRCNDVFTALEQVRAEKKEVGGLIEILKTRSTELENSLNEIKNQWETLSHETGSIAINCRVSVDSHRDGIQRFSSAAEDVKRYFASRVGARLQTANDILTGLEGKHESQMKELKEKEEKIVSLKDSIEESAKKMEIFFWMIRCLNTAEEINQLNKSLKEHEGQLNNIKREALENVRELLGSFNPSLDYQKLREVLNGEYTQLSSYKAHMQGSIDALKREIQEINARLVQDRYGDIDKRYLSAFIKLHTTSMAKDDIEKYFKALEKAVQSYHQEKIAYINQLIAELWQRTYKGSDIDSIEIRSEDDNEGGKASEYSRRSYRYRVVMKRGKTELEMRGRCSAGQKVLASCIIRLALSMAFCCDCGVLALDEPTTNLDEENVMSLAAALKELIMVQRAIRHFQLIVISHDEAFVRALGAQTTDTFYYVRKDMQGKFSIIEQRSYDTLF